VTDDVLLCNEIWKLQRPSIYAREIQNRLLLEGICDRDKLLPISAINRSLSGKLGMTRRSLQVCQKNSMSSIFDIFPDTTREVLLLSVPILWYKSIVHCSMAGTWICHTTPIFKMAANKTLRKMTSYPSLTSPFEVNPSYLVAPAPCSLNLGSC